MLSLRLQMQNAEKIAEGFAEACVLLDGGEGTAKETKRRLQAANLLSDKREGKLLLTASGDQSRFIAVAEKLLR